MTKVEELREQLVRCTIDACLSCENSKDCESYACILTGHDEVDSNREIEHEKATAMAVQLVDALIAAVREEGAEAERERIRKAAETEHLLGGAYATQSDCFEETENEFGGYEVTVNNECFVVPAAVLAPKEEK